MGRARSSVHRRVKSEAGFTLIELMVVVLIISILIAIAIPTFARARQGANDRAVQSNVRNAFTAARVYYNDHQAYSSIPSDMVAVEPALTWTNTPLTSGVASTAVLLQVFDYPSVAQTVVVGGRSADGRCFFIRDVMGGSSAGTFYNQDVSQSATCVVPDATNDALWNPAWSK